MGRPLYEMKSNGEHASVNQTLAFLYDIFWPYQQNTCRSLVNRPCSTQWQHHCICPTSKILFFLIFALFCFCFSAHKWSLLVTSFVPPPPPIEVLPRLDPPKNSGAATGSNYDMWYIIISCVWLINNRALKLWNENKIFSLDYSSVTYSITNF